MRLRSTFRWVAVTACVLGVAGSATAQSAGGGAGADAQVGFERKQVLSAQDQLSQAETMIAHMDQSSGTVRRQLEAARAARDVVKTLCLNDKLSQIDVADALRARPSGGPAGRRSAQRRRAVGPRVRDHHGASSGAPSSSPPRPTSASAKRSRSSARRRSRS